MTNQVGAGTAIANQRFSANFNFPSPTNTGLSLAAGTSDLVFTSTGSGGVARTGAGIYSTAAGVTSVLNGSYLKYHRRGVCPSPPARCPLLTKVPNPKPTGAWPGGGTPGPGGLSVPGKFSIIKSIRQMLGAGHDYSTWTPTNGSLRKGTFTRR
jgi:hypothetical protein